MNENEENEETKDDFKDEISAYKQTISKEPKNSPRPSLYFDSCSKTSSKMFREKAEKYLKDVIKHNKHIVLHFCSFLFYFVHLAQYLGLALFGLALFVY